MRFLIPAVHDEGADFWRRASLALERRGHEVAMAVISRRSAEAIRRSGIRAYCLPDLMAKIGPMDLEAEVSRIEATYDIHSVRSVYLPDPAFRNRGEAWCVERTVRHFRAMETVFDEFDPEIVIPEVGRQTISIVGHWIGRQRGATVLWLLISIFPGSIRIIKNAYHAPAVPQVNVRKLGPAELEEVERYIEGYTQKAQPLLKHRFPIITPSKILAFCRQLAVRAVYERDNRYLEMSRYFLGPIQAPLRKLAGRLRYYKTIDSERPFVYFPLHKTDDFKFERVIPHCVDQAYLIRQVAESLPQGYDVIVKEHPISMGRNPVSLLRRLSKIDNVRLVDPMTNSHELIKRAAAVTVISSTVGIEALLYGKSVLTMGGPYYSGYGVTVDVHSFSEIRDAVPAVLRFRPDGERIREFLHAAMRNTYPGSPEGVDLSDGNVERVAGSLDAFAHETVVSEVAAAGR